MSDNLWSIQPKMKTERKEDLAKVDPDARTDSEVFPLVAFETFVSRQLLCGLTVHYLESPAQLVAGEHLSIPLIMRPEMARELAAALITAAVEADRRPQAETPH